MKKALLIAAVAATASMPSLAGENYVALELGYGKHSLSGDYTKSPFDKTADNLEDMGLFAIKAGHYFNKNVRAYGYLQGTASDKDTDHFAPGFALTTEIRTFEAGAGADYLHYFNDKFYALAGGNLGIYRTEVEGTLNTPFGNFNDKDDNTGLAAGANIGLGYKFTENFSMELGYRYTHYFGNEFKVDGDEVLTIDGNQIGYLNASYSF